MSSIDIENVSQTKLESPAAYDELKIQIRKELESLGKNFLNDWFVVTAYMIERGVPKEYLHDEMEKANFQQIQMLYMIKAMADTHKKGMEEDQPIESESNSLQEDSSESPSV
jgi:hypothetical protein